ncbi:hypothetical protein RI367_003141 [Sorochytrium milnesiophthora]
MPAVHSAATEPAFRLIAGRFVLALHLPIAQGGCGAVYHGFDRHTNELVAVKLDSLSSAQCPVSTVAREATVSHHLCLDRHASRCVSRVLHAETHKDRALMVMEYAPASMMALLCALQQEERRLPAVLVLYFAYKLIEGVSAMHNAGFVHCDLKPDNFLLFKDGRVLLADFGLSSYLACPHLCGTPEYMSPSVWDSKRVGHLDDWWSLAVAVFEMCTSSQHLRSVTKEEFVDAVGKLLRGETAPLFAAIKDDRLHDVVKLMFRLWYEAQLHSGNYRVGHLLDAIEDMMGAERSQVQQHVGSLVQGCLAQRMNAASAKVQETLPAGFDVDRDAPVFDWERDVTPAVSSHAQQPTVAPVAAPAPTCCSDNARAAEQDTFDAVDAPASHESVDTIVPQETPAGRVTVIELDLTEQHQPLSANNNNISAEAMLANAERLLATVLRYIANAEDWQGKSCCERGRLLRYTGSITDTLLQLDQMARSGDAAKDPALRPDFAASVFPLLCRGALNVALTSEQGDAVDEAIVDDGDDCDDDMRHSDISVLLRGIKACVSHVPAEERRRAMVPVGLALLMGCHASVGERILAQYLPPMTSRCFRAILQRLQQIEYHHSLHQAALEVADTASALIARCLNAPVLYAFLARGGAMLLKTATITAKDSTIDANSTSDVEQDINSRGGAMPARLGNTVHLQAPPTQKRPVMAPVGLALLLCCSQDGTNKSIPGTRVVVRHQLLPSRASDKQEMRKTSSTPHNSSSDDNALVDSTLPPLATTTVNTAADDGAFEDDGSDDTAADMHTPPTLDSILLWMARRAFDWLTSLVGMLVRRLPTHRPAPLPTFH